MVKSVYRITSQQEDEFFVLHAMTELPFERLEEMVENILPERFTEVTIEYICEFEEWKKKNLNFCPRCGAPFMISVAFSEQKKTWIDCMECQSSYDLTLVK